MIAALLKRDPARGAAVRWMFFSVIGATALLNIVGVLRALTDVGADHLAAVARVMAIVVVALPAMAFLGFVAVDRRYRPLDLTLPIPSRTLWLAHTLSTLIWSTAVVGVVVAAAAGIAAWLYSSVGAEFGIRPQTVMDVLLPALCGTWFVAMLLQAIRPERSRLSAARGDGLVVLGLIIAALLVLSLLVFIPVFWSIVLLPAAWFVGRWTYGRLPRSFDLIAPSASERNARRDSDLVLTRRGPGRGPVYHLLLNWTIYFSVINKPWASAFMGYPTVLAAGFGLSGFKYAAVGGEAVRFMLIAITSYVFVAFTALIPRRLFKIDSWPVSRARVFVAAVIPFIVALSIGYGVGTIWGEAKESSRELIQLVPFSEEESAHFVRVPIAQCDVALDGVIPDIAVPWGERATPDPMTIWNEGTAAVYSPFAVERTSSPEFVAHQLSRAVHAVYGADIPAKELQERYLVEGANGAALVRDGGLTLTADYPELEPRPGGPAYPVIMVFMHVLWLVPLMIAYRPLRAGIRERTKKGTFGGMLALLMGVHLGQYLLVTSHRLDVFAASGAAMIFIRELPRRLPGGEITVWTLCVVLCGLLYLAAIRALERTESLPSDEALAELLPTMR